MEKIGCAIVIFWIAVAVFLGYCYIGNIVKLTQCDFEAPYKGEIVHAIGLIPGTAVVTFWFDDK